MVELWIVLPLVASFLWAFVNVIDKFVISRWVKEPVVATVMIGVASLLTVVGLFFFQSISSLAPFHLLLAILGGSAYVVMNYLYFSAIQQGEVSRLIPLFYLAPLFILLIAPFFIPGEIFDWLTYVGIFLLIGGTIFINKHPGKLFVLNKPFWLMLGACLCLVFLQLVTKHLLGFYDYWSVFTFVRVGFVVSIIPLVFVHRKEIIQEIERTRMKALSVLTLNSFLDIFAILIFTYALAVGSVTLTNALASVQPLFVLAITVIVSVWYPRVLKEDVGKKVVGYKAIAIAAIIVGSILVTR